MFELHEKTVHWRHNLYIYNLVPGENMEYPKLLFSLELLKLAPS